MEGPENRGLQGSEEMVTPPAQRVVERSRRRAVAGGGYIGGVGGDPARSEVAHVAVL